MVIITDLFLLLSLLNSVSFFLPPLTFWWCGSIFLLFIWFCVESTSTFKKKKCLKESILLCDEQWDGGEINDNSQIINDAHVYYAVHEL